jgi:hypothetical protein
MCKRPVGLGASRPTIGWLGSELSNLTVHWSVRKTLIIDSFVPDQ